MRETTISAVAALYLLHRLLGPGPEPTPDEALEERLRGVRVFPHAGFVHHRHAKGQTSLSWRNSIMALPLTREGIYTIAPCSSSWLGAPVVQGRGDSHRLVSIEMGDADDSFASAMIMDRCQESLRQQVLFASLPDGRILSWERFVALEDLVLESLDQGFLRITNETFPLLGDRSRGARTLHTPDGATEYTGGLGESEDDDTIDIVGRPKWLNIDDRMGIRFSGPGQAVYHNRHYHKPYRAIADDLVLSRLDGAVSLSAGEATEPLVALVVPDQLHADTPTMALDVLDGPPNSAALAVEDYLAAANFGSTSRVCTFQRPRPGQIPVFTGASLVAEGDTAAYSLSLPRHNARLCQATRTVSVEGDVRVSVVPDGAAHVVNTGQDLARVRVERDQGVGRTEEISPGEIREM